jgi:hypothetical protein
MHSRLEEDETETTEYESIAKNGITLINEIMNCLCLGIKSKKLRK